MISYQFLERGVIVNITSNEKIPTSIDLNSLKTDGKVTINLSKDFYSSSEDGKEFILAHELSHLDQEIEGKHIIPKIRIYLYEDVKPSNILTGMGLGFT